MKEMFIILSRHLLDSIKFRIIFYKNTKYNECPIIWALKNWMCFKIWDNILKYPVNLNASTNDLLGTNCVHVCVTLLVGKKNTLSHIFGLCLRYLEKTYLSHSKVTSRMAEVKGIAIFYNWIKIYHKLHF